MKILSSPLTFSLFYIIGLASGRDEIGDLDGEIPKPTPEPLLSRDKFKHGVVLMETRPGYERNGTSRRNFALGARQLPCSDAGYVLSCPLTKELPCCPEEHPICCTHPLSTKCCSVGSFCNGINTCCKDGQVACTNPEGCCPGGSVCCGLSCCHEGFECHRDGCVELVRISLLSEASVASSISDASSRSLESARSKSSENAASTGTTYSSGNGNATLVGGAVGGVLGALALVLIGVFLCRRNRGASFTGRGPLLSQQPSSRPITRASLTSPEDSDYIGGPPVTNVAQPGWDPQKFTPFTLSGAAGQTSLASQQSASTPPWSQRPPVLQQDIYGAPAFGSLPAEGPVDPRESYDNTLRGTTHSATPITFPYSAAEAYRGASSPPPRYSSAPPVPEPPVSEKTGSLWP